MSRIWASSFLIALLAICLLDANTEAVAGLWGHYYVSNDSIGHCGDDRLSPDARIDECVRIWNQYRIRHQYAAYLYDELAAAFEDKSDYVHAKEVYDKAVSVSADTDQYEYQRYIRGLAVLQLGDQKGASAEFIAIRQESNSPFGYAGLAAVAADQGNYDDAIKLYDTASSMNDSLTEILAARAKVYLKMGDYDDALKNDNEIVSDAAQAPWPYNDRCYDRATANRDLDMALADCNRALGLLPDDPDTLDSLGMVKFRQGKWDEAIAAYDAALSHNPYLASSIFMRGIAEIKKGDTQNGNSDVDKARAIDPRIGVRFATFGITP